MEMNAETNLAILLLIKKTHMKRILLLLTQFSFCLVLTAQVQTREVGNLVIENIPEVPATLMEHMNQYQNTRSAFILGFSADGNQVMVTTRFGDSYQLHLIDQPGGARKQVTFFKEPVGDGSFCPDPARHGFMFNKDIGGNEFDQLYWFDLATGKYEMISDGSRSQNSLPLWNRKGDKFITVSTRRNGKDYDLYLSHMEAPKAYKLILDKGGSWGPLDWSPDEKHLLVLQYISITKSFLYLLNLETLALEPVNPSESDIAYDEAVFSADGKSVFLVSDEGTEFRTLRKFDLESKKSIPIADKIPWDIDAIAMNDARTTLVFSANEGGINRLYALDTRTLAYKPLEGMPAGSISGLVFHPGGKEIGFTVNSPQSPGDVYTYDLQAGVLQRWTYSEVGGLNPGVFAVPTLIEYPTFDQVNGTTRKIPAFYYKPTRSAGKVPVVISIHGGPEAQFRPTFSPFLSYLVNELGVAVIAPNVRGSSCYGKSYLKLDNGYLREESVKDIGALLDWIAAQPELDASRVALYGGSYGGYMVLASMVHYNNRLACGIDIVGISNFVTFLQNTEDYRKDLRRVEYGDERDPDMRAFLEKISPANRVDQITKPLLIIQGLNDPRVPATESEQMKARLREKGNAVWYLLGKDEGHGFAKKTNIDQMQWSVVLFMQEHLVK